jgi:hypothetical protein
MLSGLLIPGINQVVRLGRRIPTFRRPALRFGAVTSASTLPPVPEKWDGRPPGVRWPMYANDSLGICVFSSCGHEVGMWTLAASGREVLFTDSEVISWYSAVTGYDPRRPWTDQGTVIQDALDYGVRTGYSGHKLAGYVSVQPRNIDHFRIGCEIFGGVKLGLAMPAAWQSQTGPGKVWDAGPNTRGPWSPASWGGHDVPVVAFDRDGMTVVTWGAEQRLSWAGLAAYCDEAWLPASWEWCLTGHTPSGFDKTVFIQAFGDLGGGPLADDPNPPSPPTPPPPPPPPPGDGLITIDLAGHTISYPAGWSPRGVGGYLPSGELGIDDATGEASTARSGEHDAAGAAGAGTAPGAVPG